MSSSGRNHAIWIGPLVAVLGFASYWTLFARWPALSDFPSVNLAALSLGVTISAVGVRRAWLGGALGRVGSATGLALSTFLTAVLGWYCFSFSYGLPNEAGALGVGRPAPAVALTDHTGLNVDIAEAGRGLLVVVFYRGFW